MRLAIEPVGGPDFPRFIITTDQGEVFDGTGWTRDRHRAALFAEGQAVALQFNALQEALYQDCPLREFTVALNIRVRSARPFSKRALEEYLERATSIWLDFDKGTGPVEDSMVQLEVTWTAMQEKPATEADGKG